MNDSYTDDELKLVARLYYVDGLGQADVASFVKASQAKVSRMLSLARERKIVRIVVDEYDPRHRELENKLCGKFGLLSAAVIKIPRGASAEDARRATGHFGAAFAHELIPHGSTVAIAGGRTMRELVHMLPQERKKNLLVVQAMGNIDSTVGPVDALELGRLMAHRWEGRFMTIPTPAYVPDKNIRDSFLALDQLKEVWRKFKDVNVALVGIGTLANSIFADHKVFSAADVKALERSGAVGEIFGRFYDAHGRECLSPWSERVMSMSLERLQQVPQVIGVVAGADRSATLAAAIRGGLVKSLIIDETGAAALLETAKPGSRSAPSAAV